ncbi:conserved hypothetical protein [Paenibacillus curdlanolyticus YK9]|uniref:Uncharacterized protein n=1 Tax=Paenibacillus curdlanolyticus YK9 TaxID=717606 RepID=E0IGD7_9BACL|nr:hypothetical protein [Paenibacillus curdlanolyticus]EFM08437.1 conserved hypothetical protein [Paenibacillus curdlanolyticus YK9]
MSKTASSAPRNGEAAAALLSILIGMAAVIGTHLWSVAQPATANRAMYKLGSWMPGWYGIGPFSGKETAGLIGWLFSWLVLWLIFRHRQLQLKIWLFAFIGIFFALMVLLWPPVYHAIFGWLPALP